MRFTCKAFDRAGRTVNEVVEAASRDEASEVLRRRGLFVSDVRESRAGSTAAVTKRGPLFGAGKRRKCLAHFARQMTVLVGTGTTIVEAIRSIEQQAEDAEWRKTLGAICKRVEEGEPLSVAMESHPEYFDSVSRSLVAAGESGGRLDAMLARLSALTRQEIKIRSQLSAAMIYPTLLSCMGVAVLGLMIGFVLPRFEGLFKTLDAPLPPTTRLLMDLSHLLASHWPLMAGGAAMMIVTGYVSVTSQAGRSMIDRLLVRLPQIGNVTRAFATARVIRVLGVLIEGKVPMLEALRLTKAAAGNALYAALLETSEDVVTRGEALSTAWGGSDLIRGGVVDALRSGERTGQVAPALLNMAEFLDEDNELMVKTLTGIIEPIILIAMGIGVGLIAVSMFLPLFDLTAMQSGGAP
ncbi:MAG: type II secretion system F family protein [bacterium]|jgi:type II secretory pathway component PulF